MLKIKNFFFSIISRVFWFPRLRKYAFYLQQQGCSDVPAEVIKKFVSIRLSNGQPLCPEGMFWDVYHTAKALGLNEEQMDDLFVQMISYYKALGMIKGPLV